MVEKTRGCNAFCSSAGVGSEPRLVLLFSDVEVQARVRAIAAEIEHDYLGEELTVVGVLTGAFIFVADLVRALDRPLTIDFIGLSSYGSGTRPSGTVVITRPLKLPIQGRHVLVVEDILDTGRSMTALLEHLRRGAPRSLRICVLLDKRERRSEDVRADYVGFTVPEGFVVGYGIDHAERYRNLPGVYRVELESPA
jgi:hypoxanthine phosphoribosyltransferase